MRNLIVTLAASLALGQVPDVAQGQQTTAAWAGWARCQISVRGPGYTDQQTHTWTLTGGAPTVQGAFHVYAGTWAVVGGGSLSRSQGTQTLRAQWATNTPAVSAPIAVFVRASDNRMFIQARHAQLRSAAAIQGFQQVTINGVPQAPGRISGEAFEWAFPVIAVSAPVAPDTNATATGSSTPLVNGSVGPMQPAGSQGTASCTWQFGQGSAAPAPPPTLMAQAIPTPGSPATTTPPANNPPANNPAVASTPPAMSPAPGNPPGTTPPATAAPPVTASPAPGTRLSTAPFSPANRPATTSTAMTCSMPGPRIGATPRVTPGNAYLTWAAVPGATGYAVSRLDVGSLTPALIQETAFTDNSPLDYRVTYQYTVTAQSANGCGSSTISVTPPRAGTPTVGDVIIGAGDLQTRRGRVTLTWTMPETDATEFVVIGPGATDGIKVPASTATDGTFRLDLDSVPSGANSWLIAPAWETPRGRWVDVGTGATTPTVRMGFYRLLITGLRAVKETIDDPLELDGRHDEIYAAAAVYVNGRFARVDRTSVHGDIGQPPISGILTGLGVPSRQGRIKAGTADRNTGGIQTGDTVPTGSNPAGILTSGPTTTSFPFLAWEGWMGPQTVVHLNPSLWEFDSDVSLYNKWQTLMIEAEATGRIPDVLTEKQREVERAQETGAEREAREAEMKERYHQFLAIQSSAAGAVTSVNSQILSYEQFVEQENRKLETESARQPRSGSAGTGSGAVPSPLPFTTAPRSDRYIGQITLVPPLTFTMASGQQSQLTFKDKDIDVGLVMVGNTVVGAAPVLLGGEYTMYISFVPAP
jgi:hypothetical protein